MSKELNIHQRINAVMKKLDYVQKENKKVNNQYTFVSHDAVTAAVRVHLVEQGIVVIPSVTNHTQDGNRTEVDLQVDFVNIDKPEDKVSINVFGYGVDQQDKGPGKAFSYAKKYAFLQLFALETGDDPERSNIDHEPEKVEEKQPFKPKDGKYHAFALTVKAERIGTDDVLANLIIDELKMSDNAADMWTASSYAPHKDSKDGMVGAIYLLKKNSPELYSDLRTEAGNLFGSEQ